MPNSHQEDRKAPVLPLDLGHNAQSISSSRLIPLHMDGDPRSVLLNSSVSILASSESKMTLRFFC